MSNRRKDEEAAVREKWNLQSCLTPENFWSTIQYESHELYEQGLIPVGTPYTPEYHLVLDENCDDDSPHYHLERNVSKRAYLGTRKTTPIQEDVAALHNYVSNDKLSAKGISDAPPLEDDQGPFLSQNASTLQVIDGEMDLGGGKMQIAEVDLMFQSDFRRKPENEVPGHGFGEMEDEQRKRSDRYQLAKRKSGGTISNKDVDHGKGGFQAEQKMIKKHASRQRKTGSSKQIIHNDAEDVSKDGDFEIKKLTRSRLSTTHQQSQRSKQSTDFNKKQHYQKEKNVMISGNDTGGEKRKIRDLDLYCFLCDEIFDSKKLLKKHHLMKHKHTDLSCPFCSTICSSSSTLSSHVDYHHAVQIGKISTTKVVSERPLPIQGEELYKLLHDYLVVSDEEYIIKKKNFVLSFDRGRKICKWAFESKTADCLAFNVSREFVEYEAYEPLGADQMTHSQILALETDNWFEAGHLIPAMTNGLNIDDLQDTYIYPNLVPMDANTNNGKWRACENITKRMLSEGSIWTRVHVVSGTVTDESNRLESYSGNMYYIPTELFKIVIMQDADGNKVMQCFLIPNDSVFDNVYRYLTTLDVIEEKAGIEFTKKCTMIPNLKIIHNK